MSQRAGEIKYSSLSLSEILFNYFQIMLIEALSDRDKQTTPPQIASLGAKQREKAGILCSQPTKVQIAPTTPPLPLYNQMLLGLTFGVLSRLRRPNKEYKPAHGEHRKEQRERLPERGDKRLKAFS